MSKNLYIPSEASNAQDEGSARYRQLRAAESTPAKRFKSRAWAIAFTVVYTAGILVGWVI